MNKRDVDIMIVAVRLRKNIKIYYANIINKEIESIDNIEHDYII